MWRRIHVLAMCAGLAAGAIFGDAQALASSPTTFTYQGQLLQGGQPFNGTVNLDFRLFQSATGGTSLGHLTASNVPVTAGYMTIDLDFGGATFAGDARWLEIQVNATTLSPRQEVMAAPYSLYARNAHGPSITGLSASNITSGQVPASVMTGTYNLAGTFTGSGAGLINLNASNIGSGTLGAGLLSGTYGNALTLNNPGNAISGSFTGSGAGLTSLNASNITTGTLANARTTGTAANTPNSLVLRDAGGGFSAGPITAAFIGNGSALINLNAGNITTGVLDNARTTGTAANTANTLVLRDASGNFAAGTITGTFSGSGGGLTGLNAANISSGTLSNARTTATPSNSANTLVMRDAIGNFAAASISAGSISANGSGLVGLNASNISTGTLANARTTGTTANTANTLVLRDAGGNFAAGNITGTFSGSGAGLTGLNATNITSGTLDNARTTGTQLALPNTLMLRNNEGDVSANEITVYTARLHWGSSTVPTLRFLGEQSGLSSPDVETVAILTAANERMRVTSTGRVGIGVTNPAATLHVASGTSGMGLNVPGIRVWQNADSPSIIGGHESNVMVGASTFGATIAGGGSDLEPNRVGAKFATVGGGENNHATGIASTVSGGSRGRATATFATVGGGDQGNATGFMSTVSGGVWNFANGEASTVSGGYGHYAQGDYSTVPGGGYNRAGANYTFAAGWRAKAEHTGAFVWADYNHTDFASTTANQFNIRASGGARIFSNSAATVGVQLAAGGAAWSALSDREAKRDVEAVDAREVAARLAEIPISRWTYTDDESATPHMGPMAQDFHAAFGLGHSDKHLTTTDVDGVALAAIQGVYQMVRDRDARIAEQAAEVADLRERLAALEALVRERVDFRAR
jgi:hypothetical protein